MKWQKNNLLSSIYNPLSPIYMSCDSVFSMTFVNTIDKYYIFPEN